MYGADSHQLALRLDLKRVQFAFIVVLLCPGMMSDLVIVSTGGMWILWFSVRYATTATRREIFGVNALGGKLHRLGSPNLQDIFIGG